MVITFINFSAGIRAFDRSALIQNARVINSMNNTYNVVSVYISSGPNQVGQSAANLPAYNSIMNSLNQINALKIRLQR